MAGGDVDMAAVGQMLADRGRCRILLALADGRALPASTLAAEAGMQASTASGHLRKLTERGLIDVLPTGRYRYYRLAGPDVARLVEVIARLAPVAPVRSLRDGTRAHAVRLARRCYDHIGGRLGVAVTDALRSRGLIEGPDGSVDVASVPGPRVSGGVRDADYVLTRIGHRELAAFGVIVAPDLGAVRCCIDWTEQRHHIAGELGSAVLDAFDSAGWTTPRAPAHRALTVTRAGETGLREHLGISWPPPDPAPHERYARQA